MNRKYEPISVMIHCDATIQLWNALERFNRPGLKTLIASVIRSTKGKEKEAKFPKLKRMSEREISFKLPCGFS